MAAATSQEALLEEVERLRARLKDYEPAIATLSATVKRKADGELGAEAKKFK